MHKKTIFSDNVEYLYKKCWKSVTVKISKLPRLEVKLVADIVVDQDVIQTINVLGSAQGQRSEELVLFDKKKAHVFRMSDLEKRVSLQNNLSKLLSEKTYNMLFVKSTILDTTMKLEEWYVIHIYSYGIFITNGNHKNNRVIKHWHMNQVINQELEDDLMWNLTISDNNYTQTYTFKRYEKSTMKELYGYLKMFILKLPAKQSYSNSNSLKMMRHNSCLDANKILAHKRIRTQSENNNHRDDNYNLVPSAINNSHHSSSSTNTNKSTSSSSSSNSKSHAIFESPSSSPSPPLEADEEIEEDKEITSNIVIVVNTSNNSDDTIVNDDLLVVSHTNKSDRSHSTDELVFPMDNDNLNDNNTNPNNQYNFINTTNESNTPKSPINKHLVDLERLPFEDSKSKSSSSRSDIQSDDNINIINSHIHSHELMKHSSKNCYSSIKLIQSTRKSLSDCNQTTVHSNNIPVATNNPIISNISNNQSALSQSAESTNRTSNMYNRYYDNTSSSSPLANHPISSPSHGPIKNTSNTNSYYNISQHINVPKTFNKLGEQNYYNLSFDVSSKVDDGSSVKNNSKKYVNCINNNDNYNNNNNNVDKNFESRVSPNPIRSCAAKSDKRYEDLNYAQLDFSDYRDSHSNYYVTRPVTEISEPIVDYTDINHENTEALDRADKVLQLSSSSSLNDNHRNMRKKPIDLLHKLKVYLKLR